MRDDNPTQLTKSPVSTFSTFDTNLLRREYWNGYTDNSGRQIPNKFPVRFDRMDERLKYITDAGKAPGPKWLILKPDEFCLLPHAFYVITGVGLPVGEPIQLTCNLEKSMFKGNKMPSNTYGLGE
jgi:hypothetical protein